MHIHMCYMRSIHHASTFDTNDKHEVHSDLTVSLSSTNESFCHDSSGAPAVMFTAIPSMRWSPATHTNVSLSSITQGLPYGTRSSKCLAMVHFSIRVLIGKKQGCIGPVWLI